MKRLAYLSASLLLAASALPRAAAAQMQIPDHFENLKVLPRDIPRDSLVQIMRGFAMSLGVRCTYCHATEAGAAGGQERINFRSDDKGEKRKARGMMQMVGDINTHSLARLPERRTPEVRVTCITCHRGSPVPRTIDQVVAEALDTGGVAGAVARSRQRRTEAMENGRYDFSEGPVNELARRLVTAGKTAEAAALLEMNSEFHPNSANIDLQLGDVYRARGENDKAIVRYRMALAKQPNNRMAAQRLQELTGQAPQP